MIRYLIIALLGLSMAACSSEPRQAPIQLDYSSMGRVALDTQDMRIINRSYANPQWAPYVGHLFQPKLADAVTRWANDRFQAAGSQGHATLIIKDASVTQQTLPVDRGIEGWFKREQATKYIGRIEVSLEAQSPAGQRTGIAEAHASHSITVPEDPTEAEKYAAYSSLLDSLIRELNASMEQALRAHMGAFIVAGGGATSSSLSSMPAPSAAPADDVDSSPMPALLPAR